jgi:hypothetical protein
MDEEILIPIAGMMIPIILVPTILVLRHSHRRREWEHMERMRAMELGLAPPSSPAGAFWPAMAAIAIGAIVPIGAFLFAWLTSVMTSASDDIWAAAAGVGTVAAIGGSVLAHRLIGAHRAEPSRSVPEPYTKPAHYDPDAYDTVGRRG